VVPGASLGELAEISPPQTEPLSPSPKSVIKITKLSQAFTFLSELDCNNRCKLKSEDVGVNDQLIIIQFCYDEYATYTAVDIFVQPRLFSSVLSLSLYLSCR
jgi:hypothetical protein